MTTFDPEDATTTQGWLSLADRLQLERELADLPTLADILERNYDALLALGDRDPDDRSVRYVTRFDVLDLADRRHKREGDPDAAGLADLARRMGARRLGILPTLESWLASYEADMLDRGVEHTDPVLDGRSTVTTAAGWLSAHLDWIALQPGSEQLVAEVHDIVLGLAALGVTIDGPHEQACLSADELAERFEVSRRTLYRWLDAGMLSDVGKVDRRRVFVVHEVRALLDHPRLTEGSEA